MKAISEERSRR